MRPSPSRRIGTGRLELAVADDQPTFWDRVEAGAWEPATLALLDRLVGPDTTFLDLGAWTGVLSLYAAARGAGRTVAVEADPAALGQLRRNLAANPRLAARIEVLPRAVAPASGTVRLGARRKPGDSMSSTLLAEGPASWAVAAVTPGDLAETVAGAARLVVKLDIEGGEYALLPSLWPLLARPEMALIVSFHPAILRASGTSDPLAATAAARTALASLRATPVGASDPAPAWADADALDRCDTWLFDRP